MNKNRFESLIIKFLNNQITLSEEKELMTHLEKEENIVFFKNYIELNFSINVSVFEKQRSTSLPKLEPISIVRKYKFRWVVNIAAVLFVLVGMSLFLKLYFSTPNFDNVLIDKQDITITLPDGNVKSIQQDESFYLLNNEGETIAKTQDNILVFEEVKDSSENLEARQKIEVPYGQNLSVRLPDNTLVYMNAGSTLEFPVSFEKKSVRQVIAYGELFFEVQTDQKEFITLIDNIVIKVLGTSFNVNSYLEDEEPTVVLIEGKVELKKETVAESIELEPNELASFSKNHGKFIKREVNPSFYTSWMRGELVFRNETFENILKKLERHYNIKLICQDENLNSQVFNASFKAKESIENILKYFNEIYSIDYQINKDHSISINP